MSLLPYDPWSLVDLSDWFESRQHTPSTKGYWAPSVDIKCEANRYLILIDIPGVAPKEIEISVEDNVLSIKGERDVEKKEEKRGYSRLEREYGSFYRRFTLPEDADTNEIEAHSKHGVLELSVAKKKPAHVEKAKKIKVQD